MIVSRTREAAGCRVSASSSCGGNVSIHVDMTRVEGYQVICLVRTYQVRAHNAAHGAVKEIAGAAHQSLWAQEGLVEGLIQALPLCTTNWN